MKSRTKFKPTAATGDNAPTSRPDEAPGNSR